MTKTMEERMALRGIINQKLEETRVIEVDALKLLKELRDNCGHEQVVRTDGSHTFSLGIQDPQIKCLICGFTEELWETLPTVLNRHAAVKISRKEFEGLGIIPPLKTV